MSLSATSFVALGVVAWCDAKSKHNLIISNLVAQSYYICYCYCYYYYCYSYYYYDYYYYYPFTGKVCMRRDTYAVMSFRQKKLEPSMQWNACRFIHLYICIMLPAHACMHITLS